MFTLCFTISSFTDKLYVKVMTVSVIGVIIWWVCVCVEETLFVCVCDKRIQTHAELLGLNMCQCRQVERKKRKERKHVCVGEKALICPQCVLSTWDVLLGVLFASLCVLNFCVSATVWMCLCVCVWDLFKLGCEADFTKLSRCCENVKFGSVEKVKWCLEKWREGKLWRLTSVSFGWEDAGGEEHRETWGEEKKERRYFG